MLRFFGLFLFIAPALAEPCCSEKYERDHHPDNPSTPEIRPIQTVSSNRLTATVVACNALIPMKKCGNGRSIKPVEITIFMLSQ